MFSLICDWVNNCEAGDMRRYRGHYDVIAMYTTIETCQKDIIPFESASDIDILHGCCDSNASDMIHTDMIHIYRSDEFCIKHMHIAKASI